MPLQQSQMGVSEVMSTTDSEKNGGTMEFLQKYVDYYGKPDVLGLYLIC